MIVERRLGFATIIFSGCAGFANCIPIKMFRSNDERKGWEPRITRRVANETLAKRVESVKISVDKWSFNPRGITFSQFAFSQEILPLLIPAGGSYFFRPTWKPVPRRVQNYQIARLKSSNIFDFRADWVRSRCGIRSCVKKIFRDFRPFSRNEKEPF
jgi:hypothetical protein